MGLTRVAQRGQAALPGIHISKKLRKYSEGEAESQRVYWLYAG
jgi:hypothetical protein